MPNLLCIICQSVLPSDQFLFQVCGHGFCEACTQQLSKHKSCPKCRKPWGKQPPFRLYLDFPDSTIEQKINRAVEQLDGLSSDSESLPIAAVRPGDTLRKLANDPQLSPNSSTIVTLLDAAQRLEERVLPLITKLEAANRHNGDLQQQLDDAKAELKAIETLTNKIQDLQQTLKERNASLATARDKIAYQAEQLHSEKAENKRLKRILREAQDEVARKVNEIKDLQSEIIRHEANQRQLDKNARLLRVKLRALSKRVKPSRSISHHPDDSLQVDQPLMDIDNSEHVQTREQS